MFSQEALASACEFAPYPNTGSSVFALAAGLGLGDLVRVYLDSGMAIGKLSPLYLAASCGRIEVVRLLLNHARKEELINADSIWFGTALHGAVENNEHVIVELLLENGADINSNTGLYGSVLQSAIIMGARGSISTLDLLLSYKPRLDGDDARCRLLPTATNPTTAPTENVCQPQPALAYCLRKRLR